MILAAREHSHDVLRYVVLGLFCGLRRSEAVLVEWSDIDWERGTIRLERQKNKTAAPAALGVAREILEEVADEDRIGRVVQYYDPKLKARRPVAELDKTFRSILLAARLDGVRKPDGRRLGFHDLRHTFSTRAFREFGYDARYLTRHSNSEAFTRYLHADRESIYQQAGKAFEKK